MKNMKGQIGINEMVVALIVLVVGIAVILPIIGDVVSSASIVGATGTATGEQFVGTHAVAYATANNPIASITTLLQMTSGTANNLVAGYGMIFTKSLSTNNAWTTGTANLSVVCNYSTGDNISVSFNNPIVLGYIDGVGDCPFALSVNQSAIGDPASSVYFTNAGVEKNVNLFNGTDLTNGSGELLLDLTYTPKAVDINITVNSTLIDSESIRVYLNGTILGNTTGGTQSWTGYPYYMLTDPVNLTFVNTNWIKTMTATNNTVLNANASGGAIYDLDVIPTMTCSGAGANISVAFELEAGENITFRFMGHAMGNLTAPSPQTFDPDPSWECGFSDTVVRMSFETTDLMNIDSNITQIVLGYDRYTNASSITGVQVNYAYQYYGSNFTNASLSYGRGTAYANYTADFTGGTITVGDDGTYSATYTYGGATSDIVVMILSFLPVLFGIVLLILAVKMIGLF